MYVYYSKVWTFKLKVFNEIMTDRIRETNLMIKTRSAVKPQTPILIQPHLIKTIKTILKSNNIEARL